MTPDQIAYAQKALALLTLSQSSKEEGGRLLIEYKSDDALLELLIGMQNLTTVLLVELEQCSSRPAGEIIQAIARWVARGGDGRLEFRDAP